MTVATDNAGGNQGLLMPKLQFRFRVNFINFGTSTTSGLSLTKQVIDCSRPTLDFTEITVPVYNSTLYLAGKHAWSPLTINLRDDASGSVSTAIGEQMQMQLDMVEQASAPTGQDYKFQTNIEILDGGNGTSTPVILETWELYGCWLKNANYETLNYGTSDVVKIALSMRFDNAIQAPLGSGIGSPIGRATDAATGSTTGIGGTNT